MIYKTPWVDFGEGVKFLFRFLWRGDGFIQKKVVNLHINNNLYYGI